MRKLLNMGPASPARRPRARQPQPKDSQNPHKNINFGYLRKNHLYDLLGQNNLFFRVNWPILGLESVSFKVYEKIDPLGLL